MNLIRHRLYRTEIISGIWLSSIFIFLGAIVLDGGFLASIAVIASLAYWIGAVRPIVRTNFSSSDRFYLKFGFLGVLIFTIVIAPVIWKLRGKF